MLFHQPDQNLPPELSQLAAFRMAEQARSENFQREREVALTGERGSRGHERVRLASGQQVEGGRRFFGAPRVKTLPVWLPVSGALVIEPGDEVIPQQGGQMTTVQDVG